MTDSMRWCDYKHYTLLDPQQYYIDDDILTVEKGVLNKQMNSTPLYSLKEARLTRTLLQRLFGLCTIVLVSRDNPEKTITLQNIWYDDGDMYRTIVYEIERTYREMAMFRYRRGVAILDC